MLQIEAFPVSPLVLGFKRTFGRQFLNNSSAGFLSFCIEPRTCCVQEILCRRTNEARQRLATVIEVCCPSAWGITRISENKIAASKPNRTGGWRSRYRRGDQSTAPTRTTPSSRSAARTRTAAHIRSEARQSTLGHRSAEHRYAARFATSCTFSWFAASGPARGRAGLLLYCLRSEQRARPSPRESRRARQHWSDAAPSRS